MKFSSFLFPCLILFVSELSAQPVELGKVKWLRDYDQAMIKAKQEGKPVLILFQEVPGCSTCRNYGHKVLSHPLIVELIETYFIPLCIYNNTSGHDKIILNRFKEPAWNNPVVRIIDSDANDLIKRINNAFDPYHLICQINAYLIKTGKKIPVYLQLLEEELLANMHGLQTATLGMYCFWSGELEYGRIPGVIATRALYTGSGEAVEIKYDPLQISLKRLIEIGKQKHVADLLYLESGEKTDLDIKTTPLRSTKMRIDPETKYYLFKSHYKSVPMTELQALKANSLIAEGQSCLSVLSPRQIEYSKTVINKPQMKQKNRIGHNIYKAWYECMP